MPLHIQDEKKEKVMNLKDHFTAAIKAKTPQDTEQAARDGLAYMDDNNMTGLDTAHLMSFFQTIVALSNHKPSVYHNATRGIEDIDRRDYDL